MVLADAVPLILAAAVAAGGGTGASATAPASPPLDPGREPVMAVGATPWPDCAARLVAEVERSGGRVQRALSTRSADWGPLWRADVSLPGAKAGLINRAVCWNDQLRFARDQPLSPLPVAPDGRRPAATPCDYTPIDNPCRKEPIRIVWLCVRPQLYLYADGHAEQAHDEAPLSVDFVNRGAPESDAAWAARCAAKGGIYEAGD
jgi:hypothetical protein